MITLFSALPTASLAGKRVLLRADLNVPCANGIILNDYRLTCVQPTIDLILSKKATIVLASHLGRPKEPSADLSTHILVPWFAQRGYSISFAPDIHDAYTNSVHKHSAIIMLENLRFFPGEKTPDLTFAQELARLGDYYVNDAFATLHRNDTSIYLVPQFFSPENRSIGLLVERELQQLNRLLEQPARPFVMILGGGKVSDKIPMLEYMLDTVDTILLGPAIVCTFLKALKKPVGRSLVDDAELAVCNTIMERAREKKVDLIFPLDYQVAHNTFSGPISDTENDVIPGDAVALSIGPRTIERYGTIIQKAGTVFYNGLMGDEQRRETLQGSIALFRAMAQSNAFSVIGGGNSVSVAQSTPYAQDINYLSTGGGATLAYLSGQLLPGLVALK